jgi:hypothetical protein
MLKTVSWREEQRREENQPAIKTRTKTSSFTLTLKKYTYSQCSYVSMLEKDISPYDFTQGKKNLSKKKLNILSTNKIYEIGYVGKLFPILQWYLAPGYNTELMYVFVATDLRKVVSKRGKLDNDEENLTVKCMKLTTAVKKCISGEIEDCKTVAALLAYAKMSEMKKN